MKTLKLGIIGTSEGNGHPYSWSAIFNNYNPAIMADCPFPTIPAYLAKQKFPEAAIQDAKVTHIWTQDPSISRHIADATYIPHIVKQAEQMISKIDGVLLARDDAQYHLEMAKPFLEAGLPIYIDKPIALSCRDVDRLYQLQRYPGQIFSCSAFQYAHELSIMEGHSNTITHVEAYIKNDWDKYAIHLIEPIIKIVGHHYNILNIEVSTKKDEKKVNYLLSNGISIQITTFQNLNVKPTIHFMNGDNVTTVVFEDTFFCFKSALNKFILGIREQKEITQKDFVMRCIEMIERAN